MKRQLTPLVLSLALLVFGGASSASADPLLLTIQPIQVCNDFGGSCANAGRSLFTDIGNKIWTQADVWLNFLGWQTVSSTSLLSTSFSTLTAPGHGQSADLFTINMWFVDDIVDCGGVAYAWGCGYVDGNGIAIANEVFDFGRIDTIAHELGHNLGLGHTSDPFNLLASGDIRFVPLSIDDIYPRGDKTSQLTAEQIAVVRQSQFLFAAPSPDDIPAPVPEPSSLLLLMSGAAVLVVGSRRRAARDRSNERREGGR